MATKKNYSSVKNSKNSFLMLLSAFGVLVVGGAALVLNNSATSYKTGASNVDQNMSSKLVKRGTSAFNACRDLDVKYTYALLGNYGRPSTAKSPCTPLVVTAVLADPYVGTRVSVEGTFTDGVFYATAVNPANVNEPDASGVPGATMRPNPTNRPNVSPRPVTTGRPSGAGQNPVRPIVTHSPQI